MPNELMKTLTIGANTYDLPQKTSDLTNDSGFLDEAVLLVTVRVDYDEETETGTITADHTYAEINAAFNAGKNIFVLQGTNILPLVSHNEANPDFPGAYSFTKSIIGHNGEVFALGLSVDDTDAWFQHTPFYTIPTKTSDLTNDSGYITSTTADDTYVPKTKTQNNHTNSITYTSGQHSSSIIIESDGFSNHAGIGLYADDGGYPNATIFVGSTSSTNTFITGQNSSGTYTTINSTTTTINGVVTPTTNDMAANKKYVDDAISGLSDATWNGVTLNKNENLGGAPYYVPAMATTSATGAYMMQATYTPTANKLAIYDSSSYLKSTTPSANDNSTKVATTAYVDAAIGAAIGGSY